MATTTPERVDEEINKYLVLVSDLRAQKNSFLPVFRLPPETLANVFTQGARDYYHEGDNHPTFLVPHWVNVSYVCRHWRNVALNSPILWTYHFTVSLRWTEELLARSKQASLKIRIWFNSRGTIRWWSHLVQMVLNHAERIQELHLTVPETVLPEELSLCAPCLQILDIHSPGSPLAIKYGDIAPLHTLKLAACPIPWYSSFDLSGVTTLFLCRIPSLPRQNLMEFLATLSRMQALAVLHLEDALPSACGLLSGGASNVFPTSLSLPCLTRLFVAAPLSTVIVLLSSINIPSKTQLKLEIESEDDSFIDDYAQLPSALAQRFNHSEDLTLSSPAIRSLVIDLSPDYLTFTITASECSDCDPDLYPLQDPVIPLMILVEMGSLMADNRDCLVADICCSIPSTHVETLHVIHPTYSHDSWRKVLGHFDGLRHLKLSDGYLPDLVSLLALPANNRHPTQCHTLVPALRDLELYRMTFISDPPNLILDGLSSRKALSPGYVQMVECILDKFELDMDDGDGTYIFTSRYLYDDSISGKYYLEY